MESAKIGYDKDWNDGFIYCIAMVWCILDNAICLFLCFCVWSFCHSFPEVRISL